MPNQLMVIAPYWLESAETWVFDDAAVDLRQEPFVAGMPEIIDGLVADIPNAREGFRMLFSASPFPGMHRKLTQVREELGGNWYHDEETDLEGWLCPALFKYFDKAPDELFVKAEVRSSGQTH